jgi:leader peptidase (prepilin peptidase) / N-methyltransferase
MGEGDPYIAGIIGLWLGLFMSIVFMVISFALGGVIALILLILKKKRKGQVIPFGPVLYLGFLITFFFGGQLVAKYFSLI